MEYFSIIYAILKAIEKSMDVEEFDRNSISAEFLYISQTRWEIIMGELVKNGYISGVYVVPIAGREVPGIKVARPILTIKGAEYLQENTMMKKAYRLSIKTSKYIVGKGGFYRGKLHILFVRLKSVLI